MGFESSLNFSNKVPLIGRESERSILELLGNQVTRGNSQIVLLHGPVGIGKTRLVREVMERWSNHGFAVVEAKIGSLNGSLAFAPFITGLGAYLRRLKPSEFAMLVEGLPLLSFFIPEMTPPTSAVLPPDSDLFKSLLFESVRQLLERIARESPLLLWIDDVQDADSSTLELFYYLVRGLDCHRVFLLLSARLHEGQNPSLDLLISSIRQESHYFELSLAPLSQMETHLLVQEILKAHVPDELQQIIAEQSSGIPLFVFELLRAFVRRGDLHELQGGWELLPGASPAISVRIRSFILNRVKQFFPRARQVLNLLSISAGEVPYSVLIEVAQIDPVKAGLLFHEIMQAGFISEGEQGGVITYQIDQPMFQSVIYQDMSELDRRLAHFALAKAYEKFLPLNFECVAYHYRFAGSEMPVQSALQIFQSAAKHYMSVHATDEAITYTQLVVDLLKGHRLDSAPPLITILVQLGELYRRGGRLQDAINVWTEALAHLGKADPSIGEEVRLHLLLAEAFIDQRAYEMAANHIEWGLHGVVDNPSCPLTIDLHYARFRLLEKTSNIGAMYMQARKIRVLSESSGSSGVIARAKILVAQLDLKHIERSHLHVNTLQECLDSAIESNRVTLIHEALQMCARNAVIARDIPLARNYVQEGFKHSGKYGIPAFRLPFLTCLVSIEFMAGGWSQALHWNYELVQLVRRVGLFSWLEVAYEQRAVLYAMMNNESEAEQCLALSKSVRNSEGEGRPLPLHRASVAHTICVLETRNFKSIEYATDAPYSTEFPLIGLYYDLWGEVNLYRGNLSFARDIAQFMLRECVDGSGYMKAQAYRFMGLVCQADGNVEHARDWLGKAAEGFEAMGLLFEQARAQMEWSTMAVKSGTVKALEAVQKSLAIFEMTGACRYANRARNLIRKLRKNQLSILPFHQNEHGHSSLSRREQEIACLVADGLPNAEIAKRLIVSPHTINAHLNNIFKKLGFHSRAELARYVGEQNRQSAEIPK